MARGGGAGSLRSGLRRWWVDGPLHRPGARRRYLTILVVLAVLCGLPAVIAAWPVSAGTAPAATLLARVQASAAIPYSGLASSSGGLALPDLGVSKQVTDLLSSTNRLRVWWVGAREYRVDQETYDGESDIYRTGDTTWNWDSTTRVAVQTKGEPQFPLPGPDDVLPGPLARRLLSQAKPEQLQVGGSERIAGHDTRLLTWRPGDSRSLVGQVKVWLDPENGFAYGVEVWAVGGRARAFSTSFLDISFDAPDPARLAFDPFQDPTAHPQPATDSQFDPEFSGTVLPETIGGLPQRRSPAKGYFGTYGAGASIVAVAPLPVEAVQNLRSTLDTPGRPPIQGAFGEGSLITTPLLNGLLFSDGAQGYVLLGSVTRAQLETMALDLIKHPAQPVAGGAVPASPGDGP
jgi:hypothetical protein